MKILLGVIAVLAIGTVLTLPTPVKQQKKDLGLSSLLGGLTGGNTQSTNLLGTLAHLTQGTDLATVLNILNFLNSIHALSNDIHSIPTVLNQTVAALGEGVGNITLAILNELSGKRDLGLSSLLGGLTGGNTQSTNLLGTLAHLTQGTDLATVLNILNFLNSIHALSNDIHSIPTVLNQTVAALGEGVGNITLAILNELSGKRDLGLSSLLGGLTGGNTQSTNLLGTLAHLTQGTDLATVLNILNFLNSIHALSNDIHSIPTVLNQTVAALGEGVGNITLAILNELSGKRDLGLSSLLGGLTGGNTQSTNMLGTLAHLTQGTDLATVLNILNFLNSIHALSNDIHSIPTVLNQTVAALGEGVGNITLAILNELSG